MEHIKSDIYIKLDAHVRVDQKQVRLKDMASIYCNDEELMQRVKNVPVFSFQETDGEKFSMFMRRFTGFWGGI